MAEKTDTRFGHGVPALPEGERRCVATNKHGKRCKQWAIKGATVCRFHGGSTGHVRRAAAERVAESEARERLELEVKTLGLSREVEPAVALLEEVHRTAGHVAWLSTIVSELEEEKVTHGVKRIIKLPDGTTRTEVEAGLNAWVKLYRDEREHLARVAKMALDAGVAERQVRIAEMQAELMATAIRGILRDLGVADHPDAPVVVRRHLSTIVEGTGSPLNGSGRLVGDGSRAAA